MSGFIHLNIHSEYSLSDGLVRINHLINSVAEMKMPAVAITDMGNLFSAVKFYKAAINSGVKPVIGAEVRVLDDSDNNANGRLILLCQNINGYRNLCKLLSKSYQEGQRQGLSYLYMSWLKDLSDDLIALSGGVHGVIGRLLLAENFDKARSVINEWALLFPDRFYLELHRTNRSDEENYIHAALNLAIDADLPVVASNDVRFIRQDDFEAHEARVCIQQGYTLNDGRRPREYSDSQYLRTGEEMGELFSDIPEAIENSWLISQRCNVELSLGENYLPHFPVPEGKTQQEYLVYKANKGLETRLSHYQQNQIEFSGDDYQARLDSELQVITDMGYPGYFLIVADFIEWAKEQGIPVGPGRGSGAGSLVAYALGITELDPIVYNLLFERFLNPERVSLPDFDVDFCMERRDEVIDYVSHRYGKDRVAQIITYGTMAAKAVVRDVGRVLAYPYGFVDQIAKLIPFDLNMTLKRALDEEEILRKRYQQEEEVTSLIDLALKLEGLSRNAGRHAGGIVIAPEPLVNYMPLYCEQGSHSIVTQFDMGDVESIGLVKFDFLGLRTLTIIDWAVRDINSSIKNNSELLDINSIPLDDSKTFKLIRKTETTAVFQLESDGMKKLIKRLQPDNFNELVALVALFRPGPLQSGMVDDFIERKHGKAHIQYPHPALEGILKPTYGVILYQEQVMEIARVLSGYTLGSADILRRAMGKKKPEEMAQQREIFVTGAEKNGVKNRIAAFIFDLMEKFAGYGFNKSHSAAYALIAYQTAWLKAHYPAAFMAAVLSSDMDNTDKVVMLLDEIGKMNIKLMPPQINTCMFNFTVANDNSIRYGLGAIKGVGKSAIDNIIHERQQNGEFSDLFDFCRRVDLRKVNRRVIESLVRAGAMDDMGAGRSSLIASLDKAIQFSEQINHNSHHGQDDMFGLAGNSSNYNQAEENTSHAFYINVQEMSEEDRLLGEKETLGFYLKGHPISRYEAELKTLVTTQLNSLKTGEIITAGYINRIRTRSMQKGRMAEIHLDDRTARAIVTVYPDKYQQYRGLLIKDQLIILKGEVVADDFQDSGLSIIAREIYSLDEARKQFARLKLKVCKDKDQDITVKALHDILLHYKSGCCPVSIEYENQAAHCIINFGNEWNINLTDELLDILRRRIGQENVVVNYHH